MMTTCANHLKIPVHFNRSERGDDDAVFTLVSPVYIRIKSRGHGLISGAVVSSVHPKNENRLNVRSERINGDDIIE